MRLLFLLLLSVLGGTVRAGEIAEAIPPRSRQLVLVTTPSWKASRGVLRRYARTGTGWREIGAPHEILLGENGLAWGLGLHTVPRSGAPRKKEGDRRAPAGVFVIGSAFGRATAAQCVITRIQYRQLTPDTEAVDDPASRFYNRIVRRGQVPKPDWKSSEPMAKIPDYELGVTVAHNPQNIPGAGSNIFIHLWRGERPGTAGCTVLRASHLRELVRWLDADRHPVLVQLPQHELPAKFP